MTRTTLPAAALAALLAAGVPPARAHDLGFAGLLSASNTEELPAITLSVGEPLSEAGTLALKSGTNYEIEIVADGTGELGLEAPGFFRAIWINEIVVNGIEVRPFGIDSVEFDEAGTMEIEFIAIRPGQYVIQIPGARGDSQKIAVTIQ